MDTFKSSQNDSYPALPVRALRRPRHDAAWSHRQQRATDAVVQELAKSLSTRQARGDRATR